MTDREPKRGNPTEGYPGSTREILLRKPKIVWEYQEDLEWLHFRVGEQTRNRDTFPISRDNYEDGIAIRGSSLEPGRHSQAAFNTSTGLLEHLLVFDAKKQQPPPDERRFRYVANMVGEEAARELIRYEQEERIPKTEALIKDFVGEKAAALFHYMFTTDEEITPHRAIDLERTEMETLTQMWPQKYAELKQSQQSFETIARSTPGAVFRDEDPRENRQ